MAIYQRGKSYYYDFVYKGQRYAGCIGPVSRTVAKEEEARKKAAVVEGRLNPAKNRKSPRFQAFSEKYLELTATHKKPLTMVRNVHALIPLRRFFAHKLLSEISQFSVAQYKKLRSDQGISPG